MSNLKDKYTEEEWEELEKLTLASSLNDKQKELEIKKLTPKEKENGEKNKS